MTTAIPSSPEELEDLLGDDKRLKSVLGQQDGLQTFIRNYVRAMNKRDQGDVAAQIREQTQLALAEMVKENGGAGRPPVNLSVSLEGGRPQAKLNGTAVISKGKGAVYNKYSPGAQFERQYKEEDRFDSIGEYLQAIREEARPTASMKRKELLRKLENARQFQNSFGEEDPGAGGFLVPEIMRAELLELALEEAIVRSRASVIPMSTLRVPVPTVDDTSHTSSLFGGVVFSWTEESASMVESQAKFGRIVLDAKKLTGFFKVPNELLADAPAFSGWFDQRIPMGLAWAEDVAFLTETGAGSPQGCIGAINPAYVTSGGGTSGARVTASHINWGDIIQMYSRMLPASLSNAVWIAAIDTFPDLAKMSQTAPGIWLGGWAARDASDAPPVNIMGRPVFFTEKVPPLGTSGDISFIDLSYYLIGDRQAVAVAASEHAFFQMDQTAYRIIERVDGRPWLQTPLTPHNNSSNTLSAYVGLP